LHNWVLGVKTNIATFRVLLAHSLLGIRWQGLKDLSSLHELLQKRRHQFLVKFNVKGGGDLQGQRLFPASFSWLPVHLLRKRRRRKKSQSGGKRRKIQKKKKKE